MRRLVVWFTILGGCGSSESSDVVDASPFRDAAPSDGPVLDANKICDPLAKFTTLTPIMGLATPMRNEVKPSLTANELSLYFSIEGTIFAAHRSAVTERFEEPNPLPVVNDDFAADFQPTIGSDELLLWFVSNRPTAPGGGFGANHLYVSSRITTNDDFGPPMLDLLVDPAGASVSDSNPYLSADNKHLWFTSTRPLPSSGQMASGIWHSTREGRSFTTPVLEATFTPAVPEISYDTPVVSADRLTIYVVRREITGSAIWRSHRGTIFDPFPEPMPVDELNPGFITEPGWLSLDNCRLYMTAGFVFDLNIYVATRAP